jgi:chemotaxis protein MotB
MARKKKENQTTPDLWLNTYSDMVTLVLCFFIALFDPNQMEASQMTAISSSFQSQGLGTQAGGQTLSEGRLVELGNTVSTLPSMEKGRSLATAKKKAVSLFNPEIKSNKVRITSNEKGLVISLASDAFFKPGGAEVNIEETRQMLVALSQFLTSAEVEGRKFEIDGNTDNEPVDPKGKFASNWELSSLRAANVLHYLADFGVDERRFRVTGLADTVPLASNETAEGRAYNRRVDIVVLDEGHL